MITNTDPDLRTKVYTRADGRVAIEQANDVLVVLSPNEILRVIEELHVCYDYCAAWKDTTGDDNPVDDGFAQ